MFKSVHALGAAVPVAAFAAQPEFEKDNAAARGDGGGDAAAAPRTRHNFPESWIWPLNMSAENNVKL